MAATPTMYSPNEGPLDRQTLRTRIDLARMVSYRRFFEVKSKDDFYLEDLLNNFIALVQQPISFAVYQNTGHDSRKLCFHFCSDKEHRDWFEREIIDEPPKSRGKNRELFELFPEVLDHEYFISIHLMHTKILRDGRKNTRITWSEKDDEPVGRKEYISICAKYFFEQPWAGFHSLFGKTAGAAIKSSINRIKENNRFSEEFDGGVGTWPVTEEEFQKARKAFERPNRDKENWHKKLRDIFSRAVSTFEFGNQSISQLMHVDEEFMESDEPFPQNMMVMYRAFDRDEDNRSDAGRHCNENGSYHYNLRFLIGDNDSANGHSILSYLENLRNTYSSNPQEYEANSSIRLLYRNIVRGGKDKNGELDIRGEKLNSPLLIALTTWMDVFFWETLRSDRGVESCVEVLRTPVGNFSRSFCDPVFQTGLIHLNALFEKSGGLDRVDVASAVEQKEFLIAQFHMFESGEISAAEYVEAISRLSIDGVLSSSLLNDLKRIVVFYYVFAGMASEAGMNAESTATYDPKNLTAILMPLKMRGAAWAVTVHATYMDVEVKKKSFEYFPFWMANFLLMTSQRQRFSVIFDRVLWENIEHRVSDLLVRFIGERDDADLDEALRNVNKLMRGEQRLLPYVFPQFSTNTSPVSKYIKSGHYIDLLPKDKRQDKRVFQVIWETSPNAFFVPRQPWNGKPRRSFTQAVSLGVMHGLQQQALRLQQSAAKKRAAAKREN